MSTIRGETVLVYTRVQMNTLKLTAHQSLFNVGA